MITGASRGLGRELTLRYLSRGLDVAAVARSERAMARLRSDATGLSGSLECYTADVTDREAMEIVVTQIERRQGPIDLCVANAGIGDQRLTPGLDAHRCEQVIATNVLGTLFTLAPVVRAMLVRGHGHIAAISSLSAIQSIPRLSTYCASKTAINVQMESLYWDLKPHGIQVTTLCPGFIDTEMLRGHGVNRHWVMPRDHAVDRIIRALDRKVRICYFPRHLHLLLRGLSVMPSALQGWCFRHLFELLFPRPAAAPHSGPGRIDPATQIQGSIE
jgi:short-subunit dehydrogenase